MALERRHELLGCVVPHLDRLIVRRREDVRLVAVRVVLDPIDALCLVRLKREVGRARPQRPDLDGAVEAGRRKRVRVLRVEGDGHDVVAVALVHLHALPALLPVPQLDGHVVARRQDERLRRVHGDGSDVVRVRLEARHLLGRVVVDDAQLEVVRPGHEPVAPRDEAPRAHGHVGQLEGLDGRARLVAPDVHVPAVQRRQHPRLRRVEVDALDALAAREELPLHVEPGVSGGHGCLRAGVGLTLTSKRMMGDWRLDVGRVRFGLKQGRCQRGRNVGRAPEGARRADCAGSLKAPQSRRGWFYSSRRV